MVNWNYYYEFRTVKLVEIDQLISVFSYYYYHYFFSYLKKNCSNLCNFNLNFFARS